MILGPQNGSRNQEKGMGDPIGLGWGGGGPPKSTPKSKVFLVVGTTPCIIIVLRFSRHPLLSSTATFLETWECFYYAHSLFPSVVL